MSDRFFKISILLFTIVIIVCAGYGVYLVRGNFKSTIKKEVEKTNDKVVSIDQHLENFAEEINKTTEKSEIRTITIRKSIKAQVENLSMDVVSTQLIYELDLFRRESISGDSQ